MNVISPAAHEHGVVLPPPLLAFAERHVGTVLSVTDSSGPRDNSRVWRITAGHPERSWYLKQHPGAKFHAREVHAYAHWTPALEPGGAPELLAAEVELLAVILTALPGVNPRHHDLPPADEREIHRQLGLLLHAFHHSAPRRPAEPDSRLPDNVQRHLTTASGHLDPEDVQLIGRLAARLATLPPLPRVPTHGDAQISNTIWNPTTRTLALIDLERAAYGPAIHDLVRLAYGPWDGRPDLKAAFFTGFGPALTPSEADQLRAMAALDALSGIAYGIGTGDGEVVSRGRRTLHRLRRRTGTSSTASEARRPPSA
ncbi:aminoglycoside phosphotransferase family protein [Streptomyces polygonati]|uniref:Aminoglycoside phosphotransferase family protein n=1 Tax=Streptomyces polygonati TaxID=1617087 RepID=A0ABV8HV03_9ACTN